MLIPTISLPSAPLRLVDYTDSESGNESEDIALGELRKILQNESTSATKKGEPRKRKKYSLSFMERKALRQKIARDAHQIKDTCKCIKNCNSIIERSQRDKINGQFWNMNYSEQRLHVLQFLDRQDVRRRKTEKGGFRQNKNCVDLLFYER